MQMTDSRRIEAAQEKVWAALNDPAILQAAIPGCESLEMSSPTEMSAKVTLKVGPVKASFGGKVTLSEIDAPHSYRISGEGSGGVAGFAKGGAVVRLEADGANATILHYTAEAQIGGKLAQLGSRLIDSTAQKLAGDFFTAFAAQLAEPAAVESAGEPQVDGGDEAQKKSWFKNLFGKAETAGAILLLAIGIGAVGTHLCCLTPAHAEMDSAICRAGQVV